MVDTRWEYGKVTWALLDFTPLSHKWEHSKGCWFNCIISWDWFFHIWGVNSHCVCKTLYFCTFSVLSLLRGGQRVYCWFPRSVTTRVVVHPEPKLLLLLFCTPKGKKITLFENTLVEFSVVRASDMQNYMGIFRGFSWNLNYLFLNKNCSSSAVLGILWSDEVHSYTVEFTGA